MANINKVEKVYFGIQVRRVQPIVFGSIDPGLVMVQAMTVVGVCGRDYCHLRVNRKQRQRHGEAKKDTPH